MTTPSITTEQHAGTPPKATLICPSCDHISPPDGDWNLRYGLSDTVYRCPECGADVTTRPAEHPWSSPTAALAAIPAMVTSLWRGSLGSVYRLLRFY